MSTVRSTYFVNALPAIKPGFPVQKALSGVHVYDNVKSANKVYFLIMTKPTGLVQSDNFLFARASSLVSAQRLKIKKTCTTLIGCPLYR